MAATLTNEFLFWQFRTSNQNLQKTLAIYEITMDGTYVDGGEPLDFTDLATFTSVDVVCLLGWDSGSATIGYVCEYDDAVAGDGGIRVFDCGADGDPLDEVGAINLAAMTVKVMVIGDAPEV